MRHKRSGGYYARAYANGKEVWRTLKTTLFSVAEARLGEFLKEHRKNAMRTRMHPGAKLTFAAAAEIYLQRLSGNVSISDAPANVTSKLLPP